MGPGSLIPYAKELPCCPPSHLSTLPARPPAPARTPPGLMEQAATPSPPCAQAFVEEGHAAGALGAQPPLAVGVGLSEAHAAQVAAGRPAEGDWLRVRGGRAWAAGVPLRWNACRGTPSPTFVPCAQMQTAWTHPNLGYAGADAACRGGAAGAGRPRPAAAGGRGAGVGGAVQRLVPARQPQLSAAGGDHRRGRVRCSTIE